MHKSFDKWIRGLWFAPTELKSIATLGQLNGIYVPHWTYDAMTLRPLRGPARRRLHRDPNVHRFAGRAATSRRRTHWRTVSGEVQHFFDDVLIRWPRPAREIGPQGPPWDLDELTPFQADFLANFKTERYTVDLKRAFEKAKQIMEDEIDRLIRRDIGGDHRRVEANQLRRHHLQTHPAADLAGPLPLSRQGLPAGFLVNARTGKVVGDRPWSWMKITRLAVLSGGRVRSWRGGWRRSTRAAARSRASRVGGCGDDGFRAIARLQQPVGEA